MKSVDFGAYIVVYNLIIGMLLMLASEKIGAFAGRLSHSYSEKLTGFTRLSVFTFGTCVAVLSATVYLVFHTFRIGL
jgi:hypothetical protein